MEFSFIFVLAATFVISASSQEATSFAEQLKSDLSDDTFAKIFAANNVENEINEANIIAYTKFQSILGVPLDPYTIQQLKMQSDRLVRENKITQKSIFKIYAATIDKSLRQAGVLNEGNLSDLAQQLATALEDGAQSLEKTDGFKKTYPALISAIANYFKSLGLNTKEFLEPEQAILIDELKNL